MSEKHSLIRRNKRKQVQTRNTAAKRPATLRIHNYVWMSFPPRYRNTEQFKSPQFKKDEKNQSSKVGSIDKRI